MNKSELNHQLYETLLKAAVEEDFQRELDTLPSEAELKKEYTPSPELTRQIRETVKAEKRRNLRIRIRKAAKRAAVIAAILIPVTFGSLLSVEASRSVIFNAVMDWKADHVDIYFQTESPKPEDKGGSLYKPTYLPDGFIEKESIKFGATQRITYENGSKQTIIFDQTPILNSQKVLDTEHSEHQELTINGKKAYLFVANNSDERNYIIWQSSAVSFKLSSIIDQKELVKIVQSVEISKK